MKKWRTVVIGAGSIAGKHVQTLSASSRSTLVGVADIRRDRAEALVGATGVAIYADYAEMLAREQPDIAIITLPHVLHKEAAIRCAERGCHVLLEKPMAMNAVECAEINAAAARSGIVLAVGHMQHYFPANIKARQIVASGDLGELVMIHDRRYGNYFRPDRPDWFLRRDQSGGGVVINLGSHSIDKIQWITGSWITRVRADLTYGGNRGDVEGSGCLYMQMASGATGTVSLSGYGGPALQETELLFTAGRLRVSGSRRLFIARGSQEEMVELEQPRDPFTSQWDDVLDAIEHQTAISISGEYSRTVAAVVDAAYRSHETGQEQAVTADASVSLK